MLGVGFEPTRLSPCDLKSHPLDHSGIPALKSLKKNASYWDRTSDIAVNSRTL